MKNSPGLYARNNNSPVLCRLFYPVFSTMFITLQSPVTALPVHTRHSFVGTSVHHDFIKPSTGNKIDRRAIDSKPPAVSKPTMVFWIAYIYIIIHKRSISIGEEERIIIFLKKKFLLKLGYFQKQRVSEIISYNLCSRFYLEICNRVIWNNTTIRLET